MTTKLQLFRGRTQLHQKEDFVNCFPPVVWNSLSLSITLNHSGSNGSYHFQRTWNSAHDYRWHTVDPDRKFCNRSRLLRNRGSWKLPSESGNACHGLRSRLRMKWLWFFFFFLRSFHVLVNCHVDPPFLGCPLFESLIGNAKPCG